jgi:hypothetical protein
VRIRCTRNGYRAFCGKKPDHHPLISLALYPSGRLVVNRLIAVSLIKPEASLKPAANLVEDFRGTLGK